MGRLRRSYYNQVEYVIKKGQIKKPQNMNEGVWSKKGMSLSKVNCCVCLPHQDYAWFYVSNIANTTAVLN